MSDEEIANIIDANEAGTVDLMAAFHAGV